MMKQRATKSRRLCPSVSDSERLGQNGDTEKQLFEKLGEWVRKPFQKPLPSQGEPWVELPNTQMVFYFLFQRTPISSKIWQRNVHLASRKSGAKKKSMGPKYSHTKWKGPSKQDHADGLVVSFLLPSTTKKRSGRSLQLGKEEPKDEGGEG